MNKLCPVCARPIENNSPQWARQVYCHQRCRKAAHRKRVSQASRAQRRRANLRQNDEVLYLVRQCRRAKTIQILTGHSLESFLETMRLVRERPKGDVKLCHIAPVKGDGSIGLFHCRNLFYGGSYQNLKFGNRYISGGLSIRNEQLIKKWSVRSSMSTNDVLIMIESFLGDVIPRYLDCAPVRKSKKYQLIERIIAIESGENAEHLIMLSHKSLLRRLDMLQGTVSFQVEHRSESKFLAYIDGVTRFIEYGDERLSMLRRFRRLLVVAYMALERVEMSGTYNKYFYVKYEPLIIPRYAYAKLIDPDNWSEFKDFVYDAAFSVLQGERLDLPRFRKKLMAQLEFSSFRGK
ncbi:hypothetical protein ACRS5L_22405 [Metapseudomonas otitidis]|uniref:hypothetical protein n=1 Tax=Metapseudomonas otitidis TaxID=319939 RepID=UPI003EE21D39